MSTTHVSGQGKLQPGGRHNRRTTVRYRCAPATIGKVFCADDHEFQRAWILDLSLTGVAMELPRPVALDQIILVTIRGADGKMHELSARVRRCEPLAGDHWLAGCELTKPLSAEELEHLL